MLKHQQSKPPNMDLAALPDCILASILSQAYYGSHPGPLQWVEYGGCNPFCTVVPLVCKRWRALMRSPVAAKLAAQRVRITDRSVLPAKRFSPQAMVDWFGERALALEDLEVELSPAVCNPAHLHALSEAVGRVLAGAANLQSVKLTGRLALEAVFGWVGADQDCPLGQLHTVHLGGGGEGGEWGVAEAVRRLGELPSLHRLQVVFASDADPPGDLLLAAVCGLPILRHLALTYPFPAAVPPAYDLPAALSHLSSLTALQLKWVPAQQAPPWLGSLAALQHLYLDPYMPADATGALPSSLSCLTALRTLVVPRRQTAAQPIPATLTQLETLHVAGAGYGQGQGWGWLSGMQQLRSLRLQSAGLQGVPQALLALTTLTRLELMCNQLTSLEEGPYLGRLQFLHLGNNHLRCYPPALRQAGALRVLYLANQRSGEDGGDGRRLAMQQLAMGKDDVMGLVTGYSSLGVVIMGLSQPHVELPARGHGQRAQRAAAQQQAQQEQQEQQAHAAQPAGPPAAHAAQAPAQLARQQHAEGQVAEMGPQPPAPAFQLQWAWQQGAESQQGSSASYSAAGGAPLAACSSDANSHLAWSRKQQLEQSTADGPYRGPPQLHGTPGVASPDSYHQQQQQQQQQHQERSTVTASLPPAAALEATPVGHQQPAQCGMGRAPQQQPQQQQAGGGSGRPCRIEGFDFLQRVLKRRGVKLTSNDLAYDFERLETIFDLRHAPVPTSS